MTAEERKLELEVLRMMKECVRAAKERSDERILELEAKLASLEAVPELRTVAERRNDAFNDAWGTPAPTQDGPTEEQMCEWRSRTWQGAQYSQDNANAALCLCWQAARVGMVPAGDTCVQELTRARGELEAANLRAEAAEKRVAELEKRPSDTVAHNNAWVYEELDARRKVRRASWPEGEFIERSGAFVSRKSPDEKYSTQTVGCTLRDINIAWPGADNWEHFDEQARQSLQSRCDAAEKRAAELEACAKASAPLLKDWERWESWCADMVYCNSEIHRTDEHQGRLMLTARLDDYYELDQMFHDRDEEGGRVPPIYVVAESLIGRLRSDLKHERAELERVKAELSTRSVSVETVECCRRGNKMIVEAFDRLGRAGFRNPILNAALGEALEELGKWRDWAGDRAGTTNPEEYSGEVLRARLTALLTPASDEVTEEEAARLGKEALRLANEHYGKMGVSSVDFERRRYLELIRLARRNHRSKAAPIQTVSIMDGDTQVTAEVTPKRVRNLLDQLHSERREQNQALSETHAENTRLRTKNEELAVALLNAKPLALPLTDEQREELAKAVYPIVYTDESHARGLHQTVEAIRSRVYRIVDTLVPRITRAELRELTDVKLRELAQKHLNPDKITISFEQGKPVYVDTFADISAFTSAILAAAQGQSEVKP